MKVRAHCFFEGKVQGVCFRYFTKRKAEELGVSGWVRNLRDGRVEAVFEGLKEKVETIIEYCQHSQTFAKVASVVIDWEEPQDEKGFEIRY